MRQITTLLPTRIKQSYRQLSLRTKAEHCCSEWTRQKHTAILQPGYIREDIAQLE